MFQNLHMRVGSIFTAKKKNFVTLGGITPASLERLSLIVIQYLNILKVVIKAT